MPLSDEKFLAFTTFKRDGTPVTSPVWVCGLSDGRIGFWTSSASGKAKRLAHTSKVLVQPSNMKGVVKPGSEPTEAAAELVDGGPTYDEVRRLIKAKYGFQTYVSKWIGGVVGFVKRKPFPYGDRAVVITLPQS